MTQRRATSYVETVGPPVVAFVTVLTLWAGAVRILRIPPYLLPGPGAVVESLWSNFGSLLWDLGVTMTEATAGFLLGNTLGFAVAVLFAYSKTAERALYPYAIALKTTPIVAIAPILIVWLGSGMTSKAVAAAVICFFPILVNAARGLRDVDPLTLELFRSLAANKRQVFMKLRLPNALPAIFSALRISTSLSVVGAIVGEFLGASSGIGYAIVVGYAHLEMDLVFAAVTLAAAGGIAFFLAIILLEWIVMPWTTAD
jgi:NitT/TauT family transport system permease protein